MCRWKTFRMIGMVLLLSFCMVLIGGPIAAQAWPGMPPGGGPEEEEEEVEVIPFDYVHPTFRGIGYGTKWNYSLTFHYATRPFWLYGNGTKVLFRQQVLAGTGGVTQLNLWTRYQYDELAICLEPEALYALAQSGVEQILVRNGNAGDTEATLTIYRVEDLQKLLTLAEVEPENILQLWVGEKTGPRFVLKGWTRVQLEPADDPGQSV